MRITLTSFQRTASKHNDDRVRCSTTLSQVCTRNQFLNIRELVHEQNRKYYDCLQNVKQKKITDLKKDLKVTRQYNAVQNDRLVVTIPDDLILTDTERSVLSKGLKFVPIRKNVDRFQVLSDAEQFYRRLRLKAHYHSPDEELDSDDDDDTEPDPTPAPSYLQKLTKVKSDFNPKEGQLPVLDYYIEKCEREINRLHLGQPHRKSNISSEEERALKALHNNSDIVIKPADKGGAIVVWRKDLYLTEAQRQLSDNNTYRRLERDITAEHQETVSNTIKDLVTAESLPSAAINLINPSPRTSKFYLLPKIHKVDNPGRPIVSACSCPTERISLYLHETLKPMVEALPSYVKDSSHALRILQGIQLGDSPLLFTMDVKSLYTSIPHQEGLKALRHFLDKRTEMIPSTDAILRLAELVLTLNCFEFDGAFYLQTRGVKMGSRFGPIYACLFVGYVEELFLQQYPESTPHLFLRYIDDILGIANSSQADLLSFMEYVNEFHPALDFTWDISPTSVNFLDLRISVNGDRLATSIFYKPTDSHSYLTYASSHPKACKQSIPYSQMLRLKRICSDDEDFRMQSQSMAEFFRARGYPAHVTNKALRRCSTITRDESLHPNINNKSKSQRVPLVLTYHPSVAPVADVITRNWRILTEHSSTQRIFKTPPITSYRRDKNIKDNVVRASLQSDINPNVGTTPCRRRVCYTCQHVTTTDCITGPHGNTYHIRKPFTCISTHVVYSLGCKRHPNTLYIGETERRLGDRFVEHRRDIRNRDISKPVPQHFTTSDHTLDDVTITALTHVRGQDDRRAMEQRIIFQLGTLQPNGMNIQFNIFNARV